jgi:hypothetical protein
VFWPVRVNSDIFSARLRWDVRGDTKATSHHGGLFEAMFWILTATEPTVTAEDENWQDGRCLAFGWFALVIWRDMMNG